jgi:hypothetical protein
MVMTDDEDLAQVLKDTLEAWRKRKVWWLWKKRYHDGLAEEPVWSTSESNKG